MAVAGQDTCPLCARRRQNDRIRCGQPALAACLRRGKRDLSIKRDHLTDLREGDDLISPVLAHLAEEPLCKFELDHGGHQPVLLIGKMLRDLVSGDGADEPLDRGRGVEKDYQARSERSR